MRCAELRDREVWGDMAMRCAKGLSRAERSSGMPRRTGWVYWRKGWTLSRARRGP
jgi:hypothetical protein